MRERRKDECRLVERRVVVRDELNVCPAQSRPFTATLVRRRKYQLETGMPRDDRAELPPGIAARSEDAYRDSMHD
jgi:hypothetical protein